MMRTLDPFLVVGVWFVISVCMWGRESKRRTLMSERRASVEEKA